MLRAEVRDFLDGELAAGSFTPRVDAWLSGADPSFSRRLAGRGWVGMTVPVEYGGRGRSELERYVVNEELLAAGAPVAAHWVADRQMAPGILRNGTEAQRRTFLPGIARAELFFGIGMSEPDAGSDLAGVRTRAVRTATGWRVDGTKLWTSGAHLATHLVVLARTDPSSTRSQGLSQLVVDLPHPDVHVRPVRTIDGGAHFNEVVFDGAALPAEALLGVEGDGWRQVTSELANERSGPERFMSTVPLLRAWAASEGMRACPDAREAMAALTARLAALRQMSLGVVALLDRGEQPVRDAAMVKDLGTRFEGDVIDTVRRFAPVHPQLGAPGLAGALADALCHSPFFTLRGGTNEILRSIVGRGAGL